MFLCNHGGFLVSKQIQISLNESQMAKANAEAERRQKYNESKGFGGRNRAPKAGEEALRMHRIGCVGEMAVAKFLGAEDSVFLDEAPVRGSSDLPGNIDVKTRAKHGYDLLVQLDDDPNKVFFLVTYDGQTIQLCGWIKGMYAMSKKWVREYVRGRPCYSVPQKALNHPETLPENFLVEESHYRIVDHTDAWITECENGDMLLNFSPELLGKMDWKEGDELSIEMAEDGIGLIIQKATKTNDCIS